MRNAWTIFSKLLKDPKMLSMCLELDTPNELGQVMLIDDEDIQESLFWIIRDWRGHQEL